ncbi:unnamed protein product [Pseudo-nitzschia multistriata]|uniref:Peptidase C14 caspase domain-containing protein n=1 Tax=Pseudo-nitzschia multistriata TaxID=183589 RepID=A0A448ZB09_9STRA|nr:unnamed protein product [Pseudo-nitzschia multistriata]
MPQMFNRNNRSGIDNAVRHPKSARLSKHGETSDNDFDKQAEYLIPAEVRMISGCHSLETSADVANIYSIAEPGKLPSPEGRAGGACTTVLLSILYDAQKKGNSGADSVTFQRLLLELRRRLAQTGMSQIPQLTSSRPLELKETPFSLRSKGPIFGNGRYQQQQRQGESGTQRALLVGINYYGQSGQLSGCINDVLNVKKYICKYQGFLEKHVLLLIDDGRHHHPTRENIIRALRRLVEHSKPGDSVYFHYSGHGGLLDPNYWDRFKSRVSNKKYDETLYPVDHVTSGQIKDFNLFHHFVKPMAAGVTVTCVMDCCHSGSVLDLPYSYRPTNDGTIRMRQSMDSLTNLTYLYILAGGMLPSHGFESIAENLETKTGEALDSIQGIGVEELSSDIDGFENVYTNSGNIFSDTTGDNIDIVGTAGDDGNIPVYSSDNGLVCEAGSVPGQGITDGDGGNAGVFGNQNSDGSAQDFFVADDYTSADCDCGGEDCDGCDVVGELLNTMFENS